MLMIFLNAFVFSIVQTLFFWYVISNQVENTIDKLTEGVGKIADESAELSVLTETYIKKLDADEGMIERAAVQKQKRRQKNIKLLQYYIYPVIAVFFGFVVLCLFAMFVTRERLTFIDTILLAMVVGAFSTEFVFYFIVIEPAEYISLAEVIARTTKPDFESPDTVLVEKNLA
jgi:fructose-specific phosphotransferase system IIC component